LASIRQAFRHQSTDRTTPDYRLVVPVTGGPEDARLLEIVDKISHKSNTYITLVFVVEVAQSMPIDAELPAEIERGEKVLRDAEIFAAHCVGGRRGAISTELIQARSAGAAIVDEALEHRANAIMLGTSVRKKFGQLSTGETVDYVLRNAPCEVIVIRQAQAGWMADPMEWQ
jgi:nucleotide-binding universal stress UspA family protein